MAFSGTGKVWMNGKIVDWADANIHVGIARHPLRIGRLRGRALLQDAEGIGVLPPRRAHAPAVRLGAHLPHGLRARLRSDDAGRGRHRQGQRPRRLLHPAADLSRLSRARRQSAALPGRRDDSRLGVGRLSRRRTRSNRAWTCASARGRAARRTRSRRWRSRSPTTRTPASSRWKRCSTATAKASRSTPTAT